MKMLRTYSWVFVCVLSAGVYTEVQRRGGAPLVKLNDGRWMPKLAFGTWLGFNDKHDASLQPTGPEVYQAVSWALEAGYRHIDTAYVYGTETQVGEAVNEKISSGALQREDVFITTKFPNIGNQRGLVVPTLRESLQNLNMTYVDLYLVHFPVSVFRNGTTDPTDYVEVCRGVIDARELGLTKSIGISNFNLTMIERMINLTGVKPAVLQVEINLNLQQPELLAYCRQQKIRVMGYTPFGSLFPGRAGPSAPPPRVDEPELVALAHKYNKTVPQIVLRYLLELGVIPIPKSVTKSRIQENFNIFDFQLEGPEKELLKSYDRAFKSVSIDFGTDSPYYPFEKD